MSALNSRWPKPSWHSHWRPVAAVQNPNQQVDESKVFWPPPESEQVRARPTAPSELIGQWVARLSQVQQPIILSGSGVLWSQASGALQAFVDASGRNRLDKPPGQCGTHKFSGRGEFSYPRARCS